jgi:1-acyl-sn-glycerol-3-phosphate acyltransferase
LGEPKPGIGRLALDTGAPVVPTAIHGSSDVKGWRKGRFPHIRVAYGSPLQFDRDPRAGREKHIAAAEAIFERVRALYEELEAEAGA